MASWLRKIRTFGSLYLPNCLDASYIHLLIRLGALLAPYASSEPSGRCIIVQLCFWEGSTRRTLSTHTQTHAYSTYLSNSKSAVWPLLPPPSSIFLQGNAITGAGKVLGCVFPIASISSSRRAFGQHLSGLTVGVKHPNSRSFWCPVFAIPQYIHLNLCLSGVSDHEQSSLLVWGWC